MNVCKMCLCVEVFACKRVCVCVKGVSLRVSKGVCVCVKRLCRRKTSMVEHYMFIKARDQRVPGGR